MNAEIFAEWMRRQGRRVFRTSSSYWYEAGPHVLQAFPYHWLISPSEDEVRTLLLSNGMFSVRYSTRLNSPAGKISYHIILHNPYNADMLNRRPVRGSSEAWSFAGLNRFHLSASLRTAGVYNKIRWNGAINREA